MLPVGAEIGGGFFLGRLLMFRKSWQGLAKVVNYVLRVAVLFTGGRK